MSKTRTDILDYVANDPMSTTEQIVDGIGRSELLVRGEIGRMVDEGILYRTVGGKIFIPQSRPKRSSK